MSFESCFLACFVDFNKGSKPAVAWGTSEISGFDKHFGIGLCVAVYMKELLPV